MPNLKDKPRQTAPVPSNYLIMLVDPITGATKGMPILEFLGSQISPDTTPPTIISKTAINATTIRIIFDEIIGAGSILGWSVKKNGTNNPILSVSGLGTGTLDFVVQNSMISSDTILISYNPATGATADSSSNEVVAITDSAVTNSISGGGGGLTTLATPTLTATVISATQINLSWTNVANESSYKLEWSANGTTGWTQIGGTIAANTTTFSHTGLTASTAYYYRVSAIGDGVTYATSGFGTANGTTSAGSSYDADAQAYITAASVSAGAHSDAVDAFVTGLKSASLWTKVRAFYPLYGTAYSTAKFNLKDAANTDAAGRLTEFGSFTYAADGATMTTSVSGDRLSTNILDNDAFLGQNDICLFVASKTNIDELKIDIGSNSGATTALYMVTRTGGNFWGSAFCTPDQSASSTSSIGRFYVSRTGSGAFAGYKNGSSIFTGTTASATPPGNDISLFNTPGGGLHSTKKLTAGGIFKGLTSGEISTLDGLISTFLTAIGHV